MVSVKSCGAYGVCQIQEDHAIAQEHDTKLKSTILLAEVPGRELMTSTTWPPCFLSLQWRHNNHDSVSNHQPHNCLLNRLFRRRSNKTSKLRVTGLCAGNSPVTGEFPAQKASNAENVSIWWRHHVKGKCRVVSHWPFEYGNMLNSRDQTIYIIRLNQLSIG